MAVMAVGSIDFDELSGKAYQLPSLSHSKAEVFSSE
jgi:hypothetical protein